MAGRKGSPFQAFAKKLEKIFKPSSGTDSGSDERIVRSAIENLDLSAEQKKQLEQRLRQDAENRRKELLEATTAVTPWKPKARAGDELYPVVRTKPKQKEKGVSVTTGAPSKSAQALALAKTESSGLEPPPSEEEDEDTSVNSVRTSSLRLLLKDLAKDAERSHVEPSKKQKPLQQMTPTELIELRRKDEESWRRLIRENTVAALATSLPTDEDKKKATEGARKSVTAHRPRVQFNETVETFEVPVGQPYSPNEKVAKRVGQLDLEKQRKRHGDATMMRFCV